MSKSNGRTSNTLPQEIAQRNSWRFRTRRSLPKTERLDETNRIRRCWCPSTHDLALRERLLPNKCKAEDTPLHPTHSSRSKFWLFSRSGSLPSHDPSCTRRRTSHLRWIGWRIVFLRATLFNSKDKPSRGKPMQMSPWRFEDGRLSWWFDAGDSRNATDGSFGGAGAMSGTAQDRRSSHSETGKYVDPIRAWETIDTGRLQDPLKEFIPSSDDTADVLPPSGGCTDLQHVPQVNLIHQSKQL